MTDRAVVVTARYPQLGEVKSRLAADMGHEAALAVYRKLLHRCLAAVAEIDATRYIFFTGTHDPETHEHASQLGFRCELQCEGDIGQRMANAFAKVWEQHPTAHVILVGTDVPDLSPAILNRAFDQLTSADAVLGPASDGGYYLIGLRSAEPTIFTDMEWSTDKVAVDTLERLKQASKTVACVDELHDIDYLADLYKSDHFPEYTNES